ncbi:beta-1,3-galactosyltransferase 1-like [Mya arenaria]|uniref:beta-1,3-galactosyltransferase 1-like n=1 Tax=Mya arenaria TaxID=6604 RepID=UPI0022E121A6|nr:beta-1,3-galactosyltransferase 1-like [Mya arenaria]
MFSHSSVLNMNFYIYLLHKMHSKQKFILIVIITLFFGVIFGLLKLSFDLVGSKKVDHHSKASIQYFDVYKRLYNIQLSRNLTISTYPGALCDTNVTLFVFIVSAPQNILAREAIRNTWGTECTNSHKDARCVFVVGRSRNKLLNRYILEESDVNRDILIVPSYDVYSNLTFKTMFALQWSKMYCNGKVKFLMKTDDDMFVSVTRLTAYLNNAPKQRLFIGICWGPAKPIRNKSSKWYVTWKQYNHTYFPKVCSGTGYVMSYDVALSVVQISSTVPFLYLEDVFVAICAYRQGIIPKNVPGFYNSKIALKSCKDGHKVFTSHGLSVSEMYDVWKNIENCSPTEIDKKKS